MKMKTIFFLFITILLTSAPLYSAPSKKDSEKKDHIHISLKQAIDMALKSNRQLASFAYTVQGRQVALTREESEFDYKYFPVVETGVGWDGESVKLGLAVKKKFAAGSTATIIPTYGTRNDGRYTGMLSLALNIPLLKGRGRDVNLDNIYTSQYLLQQAENSQQEFREQIVMDTITAVYTIINKRELEKIYKNSIHSLKREVESARTKVKVGLAGPLDIYRAEIELKEAEDNQVFSDSELIKAKDHLKTILALPLQSSISVSAPGIVQEIDINIADAIKIAMTKRIELKQIELDLLETERRIKIARLNFRPQADISVRYDNSGLLPFSSEFDEREYWSVRLVSSTDLARTQEKATLALRILELKRKKVSSQEKVEKIKEDIGNQFTTLSQAQKRLLIRKKQIFQAKQKLARSKMKFNHAMADNFDIISSETELQHARINLLGVETDYILGTYRLRKKIGTLLE